MAADEGRFGRLGEVRACWCPPGIRPVVPKQQVREYVYAYVAVAPQLGQMRSLILPYANTKMMNLFLKQVSQEFAEYFIIMQVDKAAWHLSKSLQIPENIRLLPQPSHSPELMPVEHIWEDISDCPDWESAHPGHSSQYLLIKPIFTENWHDARNCGSPELVNKVKHYAQH